MPLTDHVSSYNTSVGSPVLWDHRTFLKRFEEFLKTVAENDETKIPLKRLQYQMEQNPHYQDAAKRWEGMKGTDRFETWKKLLEAGVRVAQEMLPSCVRCGECCLKGSPTLHADDLELLRGSIPWSQVFTLRRGEPVRSPFEDNLIFLKEERIKIREKDGIGECVFFDREAEKCRIYENRPLQCRAQACWDEIPAKDLAKLPYLSRGDIFKGVELLLGLIAEHDQRCTFSELDGAFKKLDEDSSAEEVLRVLAYEDHYRHFFAEKLNIPEDTLDLVFGRSFGDLVSLFGFKVEEEADGSKCLVIDKPAG
jgi:Fe-S-cluster containining protein